MLLNRKFRIGWIILMLSFVLVGCSNKKTDYEQDTYLGREEAAFGGDSDLVSEITNEILDVKMIAANTTSKVTDAISDSNIETIHQNIAIKNTNFKGIVATIAIGQISLSYSKDASTTIETEYEVSGKNRDVFSEILNTADTKYEIKDDKLSISVINKKTKEDIWEWLHDEYPNSNTELRVKLVITLPASILNFNIETQVGEINLDSLKGTFEINNSIGDVVLNNILFIGKSKIQAGIGSINCTLSKDLSESSEISMEANMGDISIDTNQLSFTRDTDKSLFGKSEAVLINNQCKINTDVKLGQVMIE